MGSEMCIRDSALVLVLSNAMADGLGKEASIEYVRAVVTADTTKQLLSQLATQQVGMVLSAEDTKEVAREFVETVLTDEALQARAAGRAARGGRRTTKRITPLRRRRIVAIKSRPRTHFQALQRLECCRPRAPAAAGPGGPAARAAAALPSRARAPRAAPATPSRRGA